MLFFVVWGNVNERKNWSNQEGYVSYDTGTDSNDTFSANVAQ